MAIFIGGTVGTIISLISVISAYRDYDINTTMSLKKYTNVSDLKKRNRKKTLNFNLHFLFSDRLSCRHDLQPGEH